LVNNAGINNLGYSYDFSDEDLDKIINTNLISCLYIIRKILPGMINRNYGRIVNISSIWSVVSKPRRYLYSVSKSGINAMTRSLAVEVSKKNILVNSVAPGFVKTELTVRNNTKKEISDIEKSIPIGRLAKPEEIAELVSFLVSEKNSYITGQTIVIDGGYTCL
ncbi:MAG: SDR family oxidoreductase, partial [Candidatus Eremiobacterota bacterium]